MTMEATTQICIYYHVQIM